MRNRGCVNPAQEDGASSRGEGVAKGGRARDSATTRTACPLVTIFEPRAFLYNYWQREPELCLHALAPALEGVLELGGLERPEQWVGKRVTKVEHRKWQGLAFRQHPRVWHCENPLGKLRHTRGC